MSIKENFLKKLQVLKELNLPDDQYVIWGSGPLAIREIREARDVDLVVNKKLWDELSLKYVVQGVEKNLIKIDNIEIWKSLLNLTDVIDDVISAREIIEGFSFMNLSYTLIWKKFWNSKKNLADILLIEKFLKNN
jgi:hypothetical protein